MAELSQEEIDALFNAGGKPGNVSSKKKVETCNLGKSKTMSVEQVRIVNTLHESLARRLGDSLFTYLRVGFEMSLTSVEQLRFGEFLSRIPELTYMASLHVQPIDARALIQADCKLAFRILDLALGGSGAESADVAREMTEIEEQVIETVMRLIAQELQVTWAPIVPFEIQFEQRQPLGQVHGLMLPSEKILSLNFEVRLLDLRGALTIAVPGVVANALLRKLAAQRSFVERIPSRNMRRRIRESILDSYFVADLSLPPSPLSVRELLNIKPGSVIALPNRADQPVHLNIAGRPMFEAHPVRKGNCKGARIERKSAFRAAEESK
ncbi:MAG TPA: FliM/FliN family flagellar motor switch protein [Candidatus Acidoferrum sp.]